MPIIRKNRIHWHKELGRLALTWPMPGRLWEATDYFDREPPDKYHYLFRPVGFRDDRGYGGGLIVLGLWLIGGLVGECVICFCLLGFVFTWHRKAMTSRPVKIRTVNEDGTEEVVLLDIV